MELTNQDFKDLLDDLRQEMHFTRKRFLREVYREYGTVLVTLPSDYIPYGETEPLGFPYPIHFRDGLEIRNCLRNYKHGIEPMAMSDDNYVLDEVWAGITEMALGLRPVKREDLRYLLRWKQN